MDDLKLQDYEEDTQHLQGLPSLVASQVDLVLCVKDGDSTIGFPVHKILLSLHSPILSKVVEQLQPTADLCGKAPSLPMVGDICAAVRSAVTFMYRWISSDEDTPQTLLTANLGKSLPNANDMLLSHKYGMSNILLSQEDAVLEGLHRTIFEPVYTTDQPYTSQHAKILDTAEIAERCGCSTLLTFCEASIIAHFHVYLKKQDVLNSKLTTASMLRIAQGVAKYSMEWQRRLQGSTSTTSGSFSCPVCRKALTLSICFVAHTDGNTTCNWTSRFQEQQHPNAAKIMQIATELATQQNLSLPPVWYRMVDKYALT